MKQQRSILLALATVALGLVSLLYLIDYIERGKQKPLIEAVEQAGYTYLHTVQGWGANSEKATRLGCGTLPARLVLGVDRQGKVVTLTVCGDSEKKPVTVRANTNN